MKGKLSYSLQMIMKHSNKLRLLLLTLILFKMKSTNKKVIFLIQDIYSYSQK